MPGDLLLLNKIFSKYFLRNLLHPRKPGYFFRFTCLYRNNYKFRNHQLDGECLPNVASM